MTGDDIAANNSWPHSPALPGPLRCFCTIVRFPYIGLIVLLVVNGKATGILKQNGIKVGLLGANLSQT